MQTEEIDKTIARFPADFCCGDQVDVRGFLMTNGEYHWHHGYYVLFEWWNPEFLDWWYAITRVFKPTGIERVSRIVSPVLFPAGYIQQPEMWERFPAVTAHQHGKYFLSDFSRYWRDKVLELPRIDVLKL